MKGLLSTVKPFRLLRIGSPKPDVERSTKVQFRTLDEGLEEVLGCMKFADCRIALTGQLRMKIRYLPGLFLSLPCLMS